MQYNARELFKLRIFKKSIFSERHLMQKNDRG